jgi:esterase/lipase
LQSVDRVCVLGVSLGGVTLLELLTYPPSQILVF